MNILKQEQFLPISMEQAWDFFSSPKNLNEVTPADLHFEILTELPETMYEGLFILYRLRPMLSVPITWCTEITHIEHHKYFTDEQRKGPYRTWHHEHHFKEVEGGVLMTDLLYYEVGKSILGWLAEQMFVHQTVRKIFEHRKKALEEYFERAAGAG